MLNRIAFIAALVAVPAFGQATTVELARPPVASDIVPVAIDTSMGRIVVALDRLHAPKTTANFLKYVDTHKYDGESFYRAMPYGEGGGLIQGGIRSDARKLNPPVAFESAGTTGIHNMGGAIAMADLEPGKAQADFFIETVDFPTFDSETGFAAFGHVIEGMDVVKAILAAPVSPTKGEGAMKGQMLDPVVKIVKISRVKP